MKAWARRHKALSVGLLLCVPDAMLLCTAGVLVVADLLGWHVMGWRHLWP